MCVIVPATISGSRSITMRNISRKYYHKDGVLTMVKGKIKRNELDIILTDLKPVEVGRIFTLKYFYKFLQTKHKEIKEIEEDLISIKYKTHSNSILFNKGWHAAPLKFRVDKGNNGLRTISILNPLSMIQIFYFIKLYNTEILDCLQQKKHFSLRYHRRNNELFYKSSKKGIVVYDEGKELEEIPNALESSGVFYDIGPYDLLKKFFTSDDWFKMNSKYSYFAKIDYKDCFDSIYTHTFKWIITNSTIDSKSFTNNNLFSVIDKILQNINSSISNGVLVGPEFSRMIAEILLQQIDLEVHDQLVQQKRFKAIDYDVFRYIDDIYIFTKDEVTKDQILKLYTEYSFKYQLKINELKTVSGKLPYIWNKWISSSRRYLYSFKERYVNDHKEEKEYVLKLRNFSKDDVVSVTKEDFSNIITENLQYQDKIVSYVMGSIFNIFIKKNKRMLFGSYVSDREIEKLFDIIFYFYSFAPTFRNTQKLICLIYSIEQEIGYEKNRLILQNIINQYDYIVTNANLEDIIDYIHLLGTYKLELPTSIEKMLWERINKSENPILAATYLIYSQYNARYAKQIQEEITMILKEKLSIITFSEEVLLYREIWWAFIFFKCPFLTKEILEAITAKIDMLIPPPPRPNDKAKPRDRCMSLLYAFFDDKKLDKKFIEWSMTGSDFVANIVYQTCERTIFKNSNFDTYFDYEQ